MNRIEWLAVTFGIALGLWLAADSYVGFYLGFAVPMRLGLVALIICLVGLALIAVRNWRIALLGFAGGAVLIAAMDQVWKYAIHPTDDFKLVAVALLYGTPVIATLGAFCFWRIWKQAGGSPARSESTPSVVSR